MKRYAAITMSVSFQRTMLMAVAGNLDNWEEDEDDDDVNVVWLNHPELEQ